MTSAPDVVNRLYFGDNLDILRQRVADESVDLIYLDPPFNSNATYNVLFRERSGEDLPPYQIIGQPTDAASAAASAEQDRYQFEWWALGLVDARPANDRRRGADAGVDGYINFFDYNSGKPKSIIVQVKSGHVNRGMIATLKGDMDREDATIGVFITLQHPTEPMREEALGTGIYTPVHFPDQQHARLQILTIQDLLDGASESSPRGGAPATFRPASRRHRTQGQQSTLV